MSYGLNGKFVSYKHILSPQPTHISDSWITAAFNEAKFCVVGEYF